MPPPKDFILNGTDQFTDQVYDVITFLYNLQGSAELECERQKESKRKKGRGRKESRISEEWQFPQYYY